MTDVLRDDGSVEFGTLVMILRRVVGDSDAYIEIKYAGLVLRVYPSRALPHKKIYDRMKHFASFMLALAAEVERPPVALAFAWRSGGDLEMGAMSDEMVWMPVQIVRFENHAANEPVTASFPFLDAEGIVVQPLDAFRRIRL